MMKSTTTIATMMNSAVGNDAAAAIDVATEVLGSVITSIAAMKMVMVLVPRTQARGHKRKSAAYHMPARGMHGRASEWMSNDRKESKGGRMDSERACSCEAVEIAHRQSQWLDCEALVPPRVRSSSARRASKKMVDLDRYRGPLTVLVGAIFHSDDDFSIERRAAGERRKCMNSAKGRGFNAACVPRPSPCVRRLLLCPSRVAVEEVPCPEKQAEG